MSKGKHYGYCYDCGDRVIFREDGFDTCINQHVNFTWETELGFYRSELRIMRWRMRLIESCLNSDDFSKSRQFIREVSQGRYDNAPV